jgi:hypothetical protein
MRTNRPRRRRAPERTLASAQAVATMLAAAASAVMAWHAVIQHLR